MKHLLLLLVILFGLENVKAQVGYYYSCPTEELKGDTLEFLIDKFVTHKADFIGKRAREVFREYQKYLPVKYVTDEETSAYADPEGRSYLSGVTLYYNSYDELWTRPGLIKVRVYFEDTNVDYEEYARNLPDDAYAAALLPHLQGFIVKDIKVWGSRNKPISSIKFNFYETAMLYGVSSDLILRARLVAMPYVPYQTKKVAT